MSVINEHVLIKPRLRGDKSGNPTEHDQNVFEELTVYVHKEGLYGYVYEPKFIDYSDGDAENGIQAPQESGEFECTVLALGDLIESTNLDYSDVVVTDMEGTEYTDIHALVFDSDLPYNDEFNEFSAKDWFIIARALKYAKYKEMPNVDNDDIDAILNVINKLY